MSRYVTVEVEVDVNRVLEEIEIEDAVSCFSAEDILAELNGDIADYVKNTFTQEELNDLGVEKKKTVTPPDIQEMVEKICKIENGNGIRAIRNAAQEILIRQDQFDYAEKKIQEANQARYEAERKLKEFQEKAEAATA